MWGIFTYRNDIKQYAAITAAQCKHIMELLQNIKLFMTKKYYMGEYIWMC